MRMIRCFVPMLLVVGAICVSVGFLLKRESVRETSTGILPTGTIHKSTNSIYYWRTTFNPSNEELEFLKKHDIRRMYLRLFDVVVDEADKPVPNATVSFKRSVPDDWEIVPTVFVTVEAIRAINEKDGVPLLASKIVELVENICSWKDINNWEGIQLDCDWTEQPKDKFFLLCEQVRDKLSKDKLLSSTVRLHQLRQSGPPVDYGVLMVYNTDNFRNPGTSNSILNDSTVEKYLSRKIAINLPLDIALPIYQWDLVFDREGGFSRISSGIYDVDEETEIVKKESVSYETLVRTQSVLNKYLKLQKGGHSTILYHLNTKNINSYNDEQFQNLYNN